MKFSHVIVQYILEGEHYKLDRCTGTKRSNLLEMGYAISVGWDISNLVEDYLFESSFDETFNAGEHGCGILQCTIGVAGYAGSFDISAGNGMVVCQDVFCFKN